ncbi:MAG TPA: tetratricopeptide repeat protein [Candidatus Methylomirabilis sp.]|nr:tetratricopeptide repeat protein [Candidatus Methylomirabilis sp.]
MDPEVLADAYSKEGDTLAAARKYGEAIALYDRAIAVHPECCEAWTNKAIALNALGRDRESLACVDRALDIYPSPIAESLRESLVNEMRRKGVVR